MSTEPVIDQPPIPDGLTARLHKHEQFPSRLVEVNHDLLVYLPPMYQADGDRRFSVLYMHDGQNLFDPATSFIPGVYWNMGETAGRLIAEGSIRPLIIVGIYNGKQRIREYTPTPDKKLGGGGAEIVLSDGSTITLKGVNPNSLVATTNSHGVVTIT